MSGRIAILSAMREELQALLPELRNARTESIGGRTFHLGQLAEHDAVLALSGIGKVSAALTATLLIERHAVQQVLFTGVAGGLGAGVKVGDVVVARQLLQHDLDVSPLFPQYVVPEHRRSHYGTDGPMSDALTQAAQALLAAPSTALAQAWDELGLAAPRLHEGLIISGDRFVSTSAESRALAAALPEALAVEMEGAAVAQVCAAFGVPCAVVRTVSDRADDSAHVDFLRFLERVAAGLSRALVMDALAGWPRPGAPAAPPGSPA